MAKSLNEEEMREKLDEANEAVRPVAHALADAVAACKGPLKTILAWNFVCFTANDRVVSIIPHSKHVNLQFWKGSHLADSGNLLEGTGKDLRHVKCQTVEDAQNPKLKSLIKEAISYDAGN